MPSRCEVDVEELSRWGVQRNLGKVKKVTHVPILRVKYRLVRGG